MTKLTATPSAGQSGVQEQSLSMIPGSDIHVLRRFLNILASSAITGPQFACGTSLSGTAERAFPGLAAAMRNATMAESSGMTARIATVDELDLRFRARLTSNLRHIWAAPKPCARSISRGAVFHIAEGSPATAFLLPSNSIRTVKVSQRFQTRSRFCNSLYRDIANNCY